MTYRTTSHEPTIADAQAAYIGAERLAKDAAKAYQEAVLEVSHVLDADCTFPEVLP